MTDPTFPNQEVIDTWLNNSVAPFLSRDKGVAFEAKRRKEMLAECKEREARLLEGIITFFGKYVNHNTIVPYCKNQFIDESYSHKWHKSA